MMSGNPPPNLQALKLVVAVLTGKDMGWGTSCQNRQSVLLNPVGEEAQNHNIQVAGMLGSNGLLSKEYHQLPQQVRSWSISFICITSLKENTERLILIAVLFLLPWPLSMGFQLANTLL